MAAVRAVHVPGQDSPLYSVSRHVGRPQAPKSATFSHKIVTLIVGWLSNTTIQIARHQPTRAVRRACIYHLCLRPHVRPIRTRLGAPSAPRRPLSCPGGSTFKRFAPGPARRPHNKRLCSSGRVRRKVPARLRSRQWRWYVWRGRTARADRMQIPSSRACQI
ncbi:hypothetical protein C8Q70DRAFT_564255 [Cubamyces menziesii]|nr:hypothetical protein C8Q70DRAFT_564255 [Cubamyces menziesii]